MYPEGIYMLILTRPRRKFNFLLLVCLFGIALSLVLWPSKAQAYTGALVNDGQAGPYHVTTWVSPNPISVGKISLLIRLGQGANVSQEYPVRGANVRLRFQHLTGPGTEAKPGTGYQKISQELIVSETDPGNYEVSDSLNAEGNYRALLTIEQNGSKVDYQFDFYAQPLPDDLLLNVFILSLIVLFVFSLAFIYLKQAGSGVKDEEKLANSQPAIKEEITTKR
jgi:hypothetical protein